MATIREQQLEALKDSADYLGRLIPSMQQVVSEIRGEMQEDTVDFLHQIVDGLNFMLETYNVTRDIVNSDGSLVSEDVLEESIGRMSEGFAGSDYGKIAGELDSTMIPFLEAFKEAAKKAQ